MIGIDIGSKFTKVCKIVKEKKSVYSILCAMTATSKDVSVQSSKIAALLKKIRIKKDFCSLAVGGKDIIYREVFVPAKISKKDLKKTISIEASQSITEDLTQMFTSFSLLRSGVETKDLYLYSACSKKQVLAKTNPVRLLSDCDIYCVTMEALALTNAFNVFGPNYKNTESIILVNIGSENTNIVVLNNDKLVFMRDVEFGGDSITAEINNSYSIPSKLSEEIKRRNELWTDIGYNVKNSLKKSSAVLLEAVFRTIEFGITKQFFSAIDRIVITGGSAAFTGIDSFIEDTLGIPTTKWNPLANIQCSGYINKDYGFYMPIALGLALEMEKKNVYD